MIRVALLLALALPASASAQTYDAFDAVSFSDGASGIETAYTSAAQGQSVADYNSVAFGLDASELPPTDRTGCGRPNGGYDVGGRSGWVRFLPGVAGTARYDVSTPSYRSIVQVWTSDTAQRGVIRPSMSPPRFVNVDCNSANTLAGGQYVSVRAEPNKPLWLQTLGYCGSGASADAACPNARAGAVGGPTHVLLTFTPDNADGDAVPDTLDACPAVAGTAANGCVPQATNPTPPPPPPDQDADGVPDTNDVCLALKGSRNNGCPPGVSADSEARYLAVRGGIRMLTYYVKASKGARVVVSCSRGCRKTTVTGRGPTTKVRIAGLANRRLKNGTTITVTVSLAGRLSARVTDRIKGSRRLEGVPRCSAPSTITPRLSC